MKRIGASVIWPEVFESRVICMLVAFWLMYYVGRFDFLIRSLSINDIQLTKIKNLSC